MHGLQIVVARFRARAPQSGAASGFRRRFPAPPFATTPKGHAGAGISPGPCALAHSDAAVLLGMALAMMILGGDPQMAVNTLLAAVVYALVQLWYSAKNDVGRVSNPQRGTGFHPVCTWMNGESARAQRGSCPVRSTSLLSGYPTKTGSFSALADVSN